MNTQNEKRNTGRLKVDNSERLIEKLEEDNAKDMTSYRVYGNGVVIDGYVTPEKIKLIYEHFKEVGHYSGP